MLYTCRATNVYTDTERSFVIDYEQDSFMKDGQSFRYISGGLHYFRVPTSSWKDRLTKAKALGLNTIQTYIPWNYHEVEENFYYFNGDRDLLKFIQMVEDEGLLLILRPGPYIDAEWDFGGLPWWLANTECKMRTSDPLFMSYVERWFNFLFPLLKSKLYKNGGPIISFQVENEYGNYFACDKEYLSMLKSIYIQHFGEDVVLFTTDGYTDDYMECGTLPDQIYATIDFGTEITPKDAFAQQRKYQNKGPLVNSEFYTGWLDYWGGVHQRRDAEKIANQLKEILAMNASVNLYMLHGGTNFGFMNGADIDENGIRKISPTSYDYDAPISESGETTWKYFKIREVIEQFVKEPLPPVPVNTTKLIQGSSYIAPFASLVQFKSYLVTYGLTVINSTSPKRMSELGLGYGYVIYSPNITSKYQNKTVTLVFEDLGDQAILVVDDVYTLSIDGPVKNHEVKVKLGVQLDILLVNQGRAASAPKGVHYLPDCKGICGRVWYKETNETLTDWKQYNVNDTTIWEQNDRFYREEHYAQFLKKTSKSTIEDFDSAIVKDDDHPFLRNLKDPSKPVQYQFIWQTFFVLQNITDCYLKMTDFDKGQVYLNIRHNLGRFWQSKGPQKTLFVPKDFLLVGVNTILVVALDDYPSKTQSLQNPLQFEFVVSPDIG